MMKKLYIIGAGGHGKVVLDAARKMEKWSEIFFLDDREKGKNILQAQVIDSVDNIEQYKGQEVEFIVAIGNNKTRETIQKYLNANDCKLATVIHPFSSIGEAVEIGEGTVIMPGVVINVFTKIGRGCIINTSASVDHDCKIGDFSHISPKGSIAGTTVIGKRVWLGTSSTIINNIKIVQDTIIGASSLVIRDILEKGTYVGSPVKLLV